MNLRDIANGGAEAKRWGNMLYNRPVSSAADYLINNLKENKSSIAGKNAGGFLKHKVEVKIESSEKALLEGKDCEPISYEWAFRIAESKYQEQEGCQLFE